MKEEFKLISAYIFSLLLIIIGFCCIYISISGMSSFGVIFDFNSFLIGLLFFISTGIVLFVSSKKKKVKIIAVITTVFLVLLTSIFVYYDIQPRRITTSPTVSIKILSNDTLNHTATFIIAGIDSSEELYWSHMQLRLLFVSNGEPYDNFSFNYESELILIGSRFSIKTNVSDSFIIDLIHLETNSIAWASKQFTI